MVKKRGDIFSAKKKIKKTNAFFSIQKGEPSKSSKEGKSGRKGKYTVLFFVNSQRSFFSPRKGLLLGSKERNRPVCTAEHRIEIISRKTAQFINIACNMQTVFAQNPLDLGKKMSLPLFPRARERESLDPMKYRGTLLREKGCWVPGKKRRMGEEETG